MLDKTDGFLKWVAGINGVTDAASAGLLSAATEEVRLLRGMPEIVMLAGSSRFKVAFEQIAESLALQGKIVMGKSVYKPGDQWNLPERARDMIHAVQFRMCDLSTRVHVVNIDGYVGNDTYNLIRYAVRTDRPVTFQEDHVRLLAKEGATVTPHHFLQSTRRRVEFEEATTA
jgi:hypothetical protein